LLLTTVFDFVTVGETLGVLYVFRHFSKNFFGLQKSPLHPQLFQLLGNLVLQSLAGLEDGSLAGSDLDGLAGTGVAGLTSLAVLDFKRAKADQLDLVTLDQSFGDGFQSSGQSQLGILLGQVGLFSDGCNQLSLVHFSYPPKL
jgi:hypothetical protein